MYMYRVCSVNKLCAAYVWGKKEVDASTAVVGRNINICYFMFKQNSGRWTFYFCKSTVCAAAAKLKKSICTLIMNKKNRLLVYTFIVHIYAQCFSFCCCVLLYSACVRAILYRTLVYAIEVFNKMVVCFIFSTFFIIILKKRAEK